MSGGSGPGGPDAPGGNWEPGGGQGQTWSAQPSAQPGLPVPYGTSPEPGYGSYGQYGQHGHGQYGYGSPSAPWYGVPAGDPPPSYLAWSIVTTAVGVLVCFFLAMPAGIVSIVLAAQVQGKWLRGDQEGAIRASRNARIWAIVSTALNGLVLMFYVIYFVIFGVSLYQASH